MERGSWDDPSARRTRTIKRYSSDARSWDHPSHPLLSDRSLRLCLGQGGSMSEEAVLADSGRAGEKAEHFDHPVRLCFFVP
jgi:hypothetical protein